MSKGNPLRCFYCGMFVRFKDGDNFEWIDGPYDLSCGNPPSEHLAHKICPKKGQVGKRSEDNQGRIYST